MTFLVKSKMKQSLTDFYHFHDFQRFHDFYPFSHFVPVLQLLPCLRILPFSRFLLIGKGKVRGFIDDMTLQPFLFEAIPGRLRAPTRSTLYDILKALGHSRINYVPFGPVGKMRICIKSGKSGLSFPIIPSLLMCHETSIQIANLPITIFQRRNIPGYPFYPRICLNSFIGLLTFTSYLL